MKNKKLPMNKGVFLTVVLMMNPFALLEPVRAQVDFTNLYNHMPTTLGLLSTPIMVEDFGDQGSSTVSKPPHGSGTFLFKPSIEITAAVERETVEAIARKLPNTSADVLHPEFQQARMKTQFDALLRKYGYSPHNLADVMVAYAVLSWEAYSQEQVTLTQIDGATAMLRETVARTPYLAKLPDAEKQRIAEKLTYGAIFAVGAMRNSPDPQATREQVRDNVLQTLGIDFATVRLTNQGFISK